VKLKVSVLMLLLSLFCIGSAFAEEIVAYCKDGEIMVVRSKSDGPAACQGHGGVDGYGTMK